MRTLFVRTPPPYLGIIRCVHWIPLEKELIQSFHRGPKRYLPACAKSNWDSLRVNLYGICQMSALQKVSKGSAGIRLRLGTHLQSPFFLPLL